MSRAKYEMEQLSKNCPMYEPCPICFKCKVKASHLYTSCVNCEVPFCGHDERKRAMIIRRENFAITVTDETAQKIKEFCECKTAQFDGGAHGETE